MLEASKVREGALSYSSPSLWVWSSETRTRRNLFGSNHKKPPNKVRWFYQTEKLNAQMLEFNFDIDPGG
jgi:hypothetical protein